MPLRERTPLIQHLQIDKREKVTPFEGVYCRHDLFIKPRESLIHRTNHDITRATSKPRLHHEKGRKQTHLGSIVVVFNIEHNL